MIYDNGMKKILSKNKGFTLVETMVAISILMLAILGPLSIASTSLRNVVLARDQITAYYLAQEGIEYVRYVRDNQYIKSIQQNNPNLQWSLSADVSAGGGGLGECFIENNEYGCGIDIFAFFSNPNTNVISCPRPTSSNITGCAVLKKDANGFYTYQTGANMTPTTFRRTIKIERIETGKEIKVEAIVEWQTNNIRKDFTITEHILNIY